MYYVLGSPGQKYGPADLPTLRQWVAEGRLAPGSMLEDAATGQTFAAQMLPGLFDAPQAPQTPYSPVANPAAQQPYSPVSNPGAQQPYSPVSNPGTQHPYSPVSNPGTQQPYSPVSNPGAMHPANIDPSTGAPYQSPYVRYDAQRDFSRSNSIGQAALILLIISFLCCFSMSFWSIGAAVAALVCSIQARSAGHPKGQLYFTLSIVSIALNTVLFIVGFFLNLGSVFDRL